MPRELGWEQFPHFNRNEKLGTGKKSNTYELCFFTSAGFHLQRARAGNATLKIKVLHSSGTVFSLLIIIPSSYKMVQ